MISWDLRNEREMRLSAATTLAWRHNAAARDEVRADARELASRLGPVTIAANDGKWLAVVGVHGEELPGVMGAANVDGDK